MPALTCVYTVAIHFLLVTGEKWIYGSSVRIRKLGFLVKSKSVELEHSASFPAFACYTETG